MKLKATLLIILFFTHQHSYAGESLHTYEEIAFPKIKSGFLVRKDIDLKAFVEGEGNGQPKIHYIFLERSRAPRPFLSLTMIENPDLSESGSLTELSKEVHNTNEDSDDVEKIWTCEKTEFSYYGKILTRHYSDAEPDSRRHLEISGNIKDLNLFFHISFILEPSEWNYRHEEIHKFLSDSLIGGRKLELISGC